MADDDLVKTGIDGLDDVLFGGIRRGNILLVEGAPGAGKTTLGLQFIYKGVTEMNEPGLVVTFETSPQKVLRDAAGFGWDFTRLEQEGKLKIVYTSPIVLLQELHSEDGLLMSEIGKLGAKRLMLDGLTPLRLFGERLEDRPFRDTLHLLVETLQRKELTAMITREATNVSDTAPAELAHEQFVCDTVITLRNTPKGRANVRSLEVSKSRGQNFIIGRHTLKIVADEGIRIYKRAQAVPLGALHQPTSLEKSSSGVLAIDEMLGGGLYDGSVTLVVGVSGTGKTVFGTQFLLEGAKQGKPGLLVSLDEHPAQILRNAKGLDLDLSAFVEDGTIQIHYQSPQELELDVHYHEITQTIKRNGIKRVLIDSLGAYQVNESMPREFRDFVYALVTFCKDRLITTFMNFENPELFGISQISTEIKASTAVDNIVLLNYVEFGDQMRRAITVPKSRGSAPHRFTREYVIQKGGIKLCPGGDASELAPGALPQLPFGSYSGILARSPARTAPAWTQGTGKNGRGPEVEE